VTNVTPGPVPSREPVFNAPAVVVGLLGVMIAIHFGRQLLSPLEDDWIVLALAFIPLRYGHVLINLPGGLLSAWTAPITHMFVHGDATHLLLNGASLLAFGSIIARRLGATRFLTFAALCGVCGALAFYVGNPGEPAPMIGASGAIAGLMSAALLLMFSALDTARPGLAGDLVRRAPGQIEVMSVRDAVLDRRIQSATAVWLAINLLASVGLGGLASSGGIAWEAHLGGYFAGLLAFGLFDPGPRADRWTPSA
jgi:membrane associated rhomboid family serine protease